MNIDNEKRKGEMALSIRKKLLIAFIAILLIPTLTVGLMAFFKASSEIEKTTLEGATENIRVLDKIVNDSLEPKLNDVAYFANKYDKNSYTGTEKEKTMAAFKEYFALHPEIVSIFVGSENGDMLQAPQKKFDPGYDPRKRPWYTFAKENEGKTVITDPYVSASSGKTLVTVVQTVKDGSGVVAIDISLDAIKESTNSIKIGEKGYPFILSSAGLYLVHPTEKPGDRSKVFTDSMLSKKQADHSYTLNGAEKQLTFVTNELTGWKIAGTMNIDEANQKAEPILFTTILIISVFIVIGIIVSYVIVLSITKPLKRLILLTEKVSDGDLTQTFEIKNKDEIGQLGESFNKMILSLRDIIHHVSEKSAQLASASEQLNASSDQNNAATEQVAKAIQHVAAGMDKQTDMSNESTQTVREMSAGIQSIMENAQNVSKTSMEATDAVAGGESAITLSIKQMENINGTVQDLGGVINALGDRSKEISQIINVISDIAGQTNLLALNAAIEAARAGEQGKGFAVVADEVRKLAEQSAKSTENIRHLISSIQSETDTAVHAMDKGTKAVEKGIEIVNDAGTSFRKIQLFVDNVTSQIQEVSASVQQMNHGVENVVGIVTEIEEIAKTSAQESQEVSAATEEQLASMQEIAASATSLSYMAEELQESVGKFKI